LGHKSEFGSLKMLNILIVDLILYRDLTLRRQFIHLKNGFVEVSSKNLVRYRPENNFVVLLK